MSSHPLGLTRLKYIRSGWHLLLTRLRFRTFLPLSLRPLPFHPTQLFPRRRTRRRRQFFDEYVLHLHDRVAAAVDLDADDAVAGDVRVLLDVIDALHAVDPGLDAAAVGADDV